MTTIDCRLPYDLGKVVWDFCPYHSIYKTVLKELIINHYIDIIKKIVKNVSRHTGICLFDIKIYSITEEKNDDYGEMDNTTISLCNIYDELGIEYVDKSYHPDAEKYIHALRNQVHNIHYGSLTKCLTEIFAEILDNDGSIDVLLNVKFEGHLGKFNPDEFSEPEWLSKKTNCMCGNWELRQWYDEKFNIKLETHWQNIYAREESWCC